MTHLLNQVLLKNLKCSQSARISTKFHNAVMSIDLKIRSKLNHLQMNLLKMTVMKDFNTFLAIPSRGRYSDRVSCSKTWH